MLDKAIRIASVAFEGAYDKGGNPYILHLLYVMNKVKYYGDQDVMIAAVLHDLIEDTDWTLQDLSEEGFSNKVIYLLELLTHNPEDSYEKYISKICLHPDAIVIKMKDLRHNSDITRIKGIREKDIDRIEKYHRSYLKLKETLNNFSGNISNENMC